MTAQSSGQIQEQRMEQSLTPQMLQSLKILQAPILDLQTMIREEMDQNPTLERDAPETEQSTDFNEAARKELTEEHEIGELSELVEGEDAFYSQHEIRSSAQEEAHQFRMDSIEGSLSLQEHLLKQVPLAGLDAREREIAEILIGSIDDDGYLQLDVDRIVESTPEFPEKLFLNVLTVIQGFDPVGVGSRTLKECLLIQLGQQGKGESLEALLVRNHLDLLGAHQYEHIARAMHLQPEKVRELSAAIAQLNPKPGRNVTTDRTEYVIPEIMVEKQNEAWVITQNKSLYPRLFISPKSLELLKDKTTAADTRKYIREKIAKSKFFIRSIDQRQDTIYRMACEIVHIQEEFLGKGMIHLKPLTMKQVADRLNIHETTVGRACHGKYMATPQGIFEFKHFFTPGVAQADGRLISNAVLKSAVASIVRTESRRRPLSDQRIMDELAQQGLHIARRTVAKYREQLHILPARLRRQA